MPRKQRGGFSFLEPGSWFNKSNQDQQHSSDNSPVNQQPPTTIRDATKQTIHTTFLSAAITALAAVRLSKGAAEGVAATGEQTGAELTSETVKQTGLVGEQAIKTTGELTVAELKGLSEGGQVFAEEFTKHALKTAESLGVGGLITAESIGKALQSPEVQQEMEKVAKDALLTSEYGARDAILVVEFVTKLLAKVLITAVQSIAIGGRRRTRRSKRRHLKRRTAKHR
jgi:hypothetical protein